MYKAFLVFALATATTCIASDNQREYGRMHPDGVINAAKVPLFALKEPVFVRIGIQEDAVISTGACDVVGLEDKKSNEPRKLGRLWIGHGKVPLRKFLTDNVDVLSYLQLSVASPYEGELVETPLYSNWKLLSVDDGGYADFEVSAGPTIEEQTKNEVFRLPLDTSAILEGGVLYPGGGPREYVIRFNCNYEYIDEGGLIRNEDKGQPVLRLSYESEMLRNGQVTTNHMKTLKHVHVGDEFKLLGERTYRISKIVFDDPKTKRRGWIEIEPGGEKLAMGE